MFSNDLIRSLCRHSNEKRLVLSQADYQRVLSANKAFFEHESEQKGSEAWGSWLLAKARLGIKQLAAAPALELCAGSGFAYLSLAGVIEEIEDAWFVDLSASQCKTFRDRAFTECGNDKEPKIVCGDIGRLPFRDGTFKLVYGNSFLHHLPDVPGYLGEVSRVMQQSGTFIVLHEPTRLAPFWESFPISLIKDTRTNSLTDIWLIDPDTIRDLLLEAGFKSVEIVPAELISSIILSPLLIVMSKIAPRRRGKWVPVVKKWLVWMERMLPRTLLMKTAPSIAIIAIK